MSSGCGEDHGYFHDGFSIAAYQPGQGSSSVVGHGDTPDRVEHTDCDFAVFN